MIFLFKKPTFSIYLLLACSGVYLTKGMEQEEPHKGIKKEEQAESVSSVENLSCKLRAFLTNFLVNTSGWLKGYTQQQQTSCLENLLPDLKAYIMTFLLSEDNSEKAIENVKHLAVTSKKMHSIMYDSHILGYLIREISTRFNKTLIDVAMAFKNKGSSWLKEYANQKEIVGECLLEAVEKGDVALIPFLLNAGADVNLGDSDDNFALHTAVYYGNKEIAKLLLNAGADVNKPTKNSSNTPLYYAARVGDKDIGELLLNAGADVNQVNKDGNTPLHEAASKGHKDIVELLLKASADVNKTDKIGNTPLSLASLQNRQDIVDLLHKFGANK
jgi:hypothetical protein